jgi:hypothetical protein
VNAQTCIALVTSRGKFAYLLKTLAGLISQLIRRGIFVAEELRGNKEVPLRYHDNAPYLHLVIEMECNFGLCTVKLI